MTLLLPLLLPVSRRRTRRESTSANAPPADRSCTEVRSRQSTDDTFVPADRFGGDDLHAFFPSSRTKTEVCHVHDVTLRKYGHDNTVVSHRDGVAPLETDTSDGDGRELVAKGERKKRRRSTV